jgi:proline racemase
MEVSTVDYHTGGEPFRIVVDGGVELPGATMLEKRRHAREQLDHLRRFLVYEPRGHADMYGCFVTEPVAPGSDLGVVFFHNEGYSTACGHGTIALATWAVEHGIVAVAWPRTELRIDVPSGTLEVSVDVGRDGVGEVRFQNVPAFVHLAGLAVATSAGTVEVDVAYGGAFYASLPASDVGLAVTPGQLPDLIRLGREIKGTIEAERDVSHPEQPELHGVYGVIFHQDEPGPPLTQRNVAVFADGEVDRSPCGSGTSARLAILHAAGLLGTGRPLRHLSIVGSVFSGRVVAETSVAGRPAVVTEVAGRASMTGAHRFVRRPGDELPDGFLLR